MKEAVLAKKLSDKVPERPGFVMSTHYEKRHVEAAVTASGSTVINVGEMLVIVAHPGSGKTHLCEALATNYTGKTQRIKSHAFGLEANVQPDKKCLVIDAERPLDQCRDSLDRIHYRLGKREQCISETGEIKGLTYLCWIELAGLEKRKKALESIVSTGEYGLVILDGILGIATLNDEKESSEVVQWLLSLASKYSFALVITMHPNKGTDTMAGHIGAFLYRYARACLLVRKHQHDSNVREITSDFSQGKMSYGSGFNSFMRYSEEAGTFLSEDHAPMAVGAQSVFSSDTIKTVFWEQSLKGTKKVPAGILHRRYMELTGKSHPSAKAHIKACYEMDIIGKEGNGKATVYYLIESDNHSDKYG